MTVFGADIHPVFQAGINIEAMPSVGIDFLSVKVSQGTSSVYLGQGAQSMIHRALGAGLLVLGYHYLTPGNEDAQAGVFAAALTACGAIPGVSDVESLNGAGQPNLTVGGIRGFHDACRRRGADVRFMYLPRWYWSRIGSPDLSGLPMLWASGYPTGRVDVPQALYQAVTPTYWTAYGGLPVGPLQFAESAIVAGHQPVDANAFPGDRAQFASLLGPPRRNRKEHDEMDQLPATPAPANPNSPPSTWPQRVYDVGFDLAGGWEGDFAFEFGVQEWAGRNTDAVRGYLALASWRTPGGLVPVRPELAVGGPGLTIYDHTPTAGFVAPPGSTALVVNYAAPGGAYVSEGRSA